MKHFLVYTNRHKDRDLAVTNRIVSYLTEKGQSVRVMADGELDFSGQVIPRSNSDFPQDVDCMLVLGGDGTVLQAVRDTIGWGIPIIGINLGTLGYMTEVEPANIEEALDRIIAEDYQQECRMMLNGKVYTQQGQTKEGWALNDIVISRSGSLQIIKFQIYVNGQFLNCYDADGMIVTTPTGSTGYNLSAGGPLVEPNAQLILLTPICPHSLNQRSIVLSANDCIEIKIPAGREGKEQSVEASFDGSFGIPLHTGDRIRIVKSEKVTRFIRLNQVSFLEILHKKMSN